jgi:two-component system, chemotaxis family, response regulator Rcp1
MSNPEKLVILSVEDNEADVCILKKLFSRCKIQVEMQSVRNGEEAMNFLLKKEGYTDAPTPALILLDLNLPKKDGREFLREIKQSPEYAHIPILILTTSHYQEDIQTCYELQASSYFLKPQDISEYQRLIDNIAELWFTKACLPKGHFSHTSR